MKVYVILESFTDYKGGNANCFGVFLSKEKAIESMPSIILERYGGMSQKEWNAWYEDDFDTHFNKELGLWSYDDGDTITEFYIQSCDLNDQE